jgi:hypothetical protein
MNLNALTAAKLIDLLEREAPDTIVKVALCDKFGQNGEDGTLVDDDHVWNREDGVVVLMAWDESLDDDEEAEA